MAEWSRDTLLFNACCHWWVNGLTGAFLGDRYCICWVGLMVQLDSIHSLNMKWNVQITIVNSRGIERWCTATSCIFWISSMISLVTSITLLKVPIKHWACWTSQLWLMAFNQCLLDSMLISTWHHQPPVSTQKLGSPCHTAFSHGCWVHGFPCYSL